MGLPFETDGGAAAKGAIGAIVLQNDETLEPEMRAVFSDVAVYHARIPSAPEVTPETLKAMEADLPKTAALLPRETAFAAIGYGCTSGSTIIGPDRVRDLVRTGHPHAEVTNPLTAVMAACDALGVRRIGFLTPYIADVSAAMRSALEENGLEIAAFGSFEQSEEAVVARIAPASVLDAMIAVGRDPQAEAVFASCTNLRSLGIIDEAEARLGKPVLSSNLAFFWHLRRLAGLPVTGHGPGRLFNPDSF